MDFTATLGILGLAFALGLLHAFDADHIMAVTSLSSRLPSRAAALPICLRWSIGHGTSLMLLGCAVLLLGMTIPESLARGAEVVVGGLLVLIGVLVLYDLHVRRIHVHFHQHHGHPPHAHWHSHRHHDHHWHRHGATLVGFVHGVAGSAPLLALLPMAQLDSPAMGLAYLVTFSLGVLLAMVVAGGILGHLYARLADSARLLTTVRSAVGAGAIALGSWWLAGFA